MNMRKNGLFIAALTGIVLVSSCASKKDLVNCQTENRELTANYQSAKEELAASKARVASLEDQLAQQKNNYTRLQQSLDQSLSNANSNKDRKSTRLNSSHANIS